MYQRNNQGWLKHFDFILLDVLVLQLSFIIAFGIRQHAFPYDYQAYRMLAFLIALVDVMVAIIFNTMHNVMKRGYYKEFEQTFKQAFFVFLIVTFYMFSTQTGGTYSRIALSLTAAFHLILGYFSRLAWKQVVHKIAKGSKKSTMILVADEYQVPEILSKAKDIDDFEYKGIVLTNRDATGEEIQGVKVIGSLETAADYICREWVDEVFVYPSSLTEMETKQSDMYKSVEGFIEDAYSIFTKTDYDVEPGEVKEEATVAALIDGCRQMAIPVHVRLPITSVGGKGFIEKVGGYNVLTSTANYASPLQLAIKRAMDILGGLVGSIIALVIIAVVGPKIKKESPGPILFKQTRIGQNGKKFQIYKIRSMYMDAEDRKAELMKENRVSDGMMFKLDWDPRIIGNKIVDGQKVTGIGEKIRSGSWDEWPQFFNILMGHMSLVGTRPPTVDEWEKYKYHHRARLATKPGLTGMWQVSGRSKITNFEEVVRLDTEYINRWSVGLDIRILLKTVKAVFTKDGAM